MATREAETTSSSCEGVIDNDDKDGGAVWLEYADRERRNANALESVSSFFSSSAPPESWDSQQDRQRPHARARPRSDALCCGFERSSLRPLSSFAFDPAIAIARASCRNSMMVRATAMSVCCMARSDAEGSEDHSLPPLSSPASSSSSSSSSSPSHRNLMDCSTISRQTGVTRLMRAKRSFERREASAASAAGAALSAGGS
mmetsp:Transcript_7878/g.14550  ORF Transcript_7878/g.14550 Transcript_7878/m.14550 type:complete len:201 (-) Transcript_7878:259-861(-)